MMVEELCLLRRRSSRRANGDFKRLSIHSTFGNLEQELFILSWSNLDATDAESDTFKVQWKFSTEFALQFIRPSLEVMEPNRPQNQNFC